MVVQLFSWFPLSSRRWCEGSSRKSSRSHQHRRVLVVHCSQNIQILSKKDLDPSYVIIWIQISSRNSTCNDTVGRRSTLDGKRWFGPASPSRTQELPKIRQISWFISSNAFSNSKVHERPKN